VRPADEQNRAILRDVESAARSDLPEEDVDDEPPKDKDEVICEISQMTRRGRSMDSVAEVSR
jgi:hypothetical protein